ncbi:hypothetical protein ACLOJK_035964 [Asimina triloba]
MDNICGLKKLWVDIDGRRRFKARDEVAGGSRRGQGWGEGCGGVGGEATGRRLVTLLIVPSKVEAHVAMTAGASIAASVVRAILAIGEESQCQSEAVAEEVARQTDFMSRRSHTLLGGRVSEDELPTPPGIEIVAGRIESCKCGVAKEAVGWTVEMETTRMVGVTIVKKRIEDEGGWEPKELKKVLNKAFSFMLRELG